MERETFSKKRNGLKRKDAPRSDIENDLGNLLHIVRKAFFSPPFYVKSIFGPYYTWVLPHRKYSELTIVDLWKPLQMARYFRDLSVPAFANDPPDLVRTFFPPALHEVFWRPSTFFQQPDPFDSVTSFPQERWFYINGVATNEAVARTNAALLSKLFHRPLTVIHNATDALFVDLLECAVGKEFKTTPRLDRRTMTEPALKATHAILSALMEPALDKVVVLAHSQGTIIMANVLRAIKRVLKLDGHPEKKASKSPKSPLTTTPSQATLPGVSQLVKEIAGEATNEPMQLLREMLTQEFARFCAFVKTEKKHPLMKLEVYTFANCADRMLYVSEDNAASTSYPRLEHFANECDLVARLGVLSPLLDPTDAEALVHIDGPIYERQGAWGHLLNEHYLYDIYDHLSGQGSFPNPYPLQQKHQHRYPATPRLYQYFQGKRPAL